MRMRTAPLIAGLLLFTPTVSAQGMDAKDAYTVHQMLHDAYDAVKQHYYDQKFRGIDMEARYHEFEAKLKTAPTLNAGVAMVAGFLDGLQDSHTYFEPPARPYKIDYGYRVGFVGDDAYVTRVRPETDAQGKVNPGDRVLSVNGGPVTRDTFFAMEYYLNVLSPQGSTKLELRDPSGADRSVETATKVVPKPRVVDLSGAAADMEMNDLVREQEESDHLSRSRVVVVGDAVIWKMPIFNLSPAAMDEVWTNARKHAALIIDLRGNPGGIVDVLTRMIGSAIDHDVTVAHKVTRKGSSSVMTAKTRGANAFAGKIVVLVDSGSASCSELFARVMQIEKRATVIGDRSAGAVMEAQVYQYAQGDASMGMLYEFSVTEADLVMQDGKSLEKSGVTPDEIVLPTAADIAAGRDPVMAHAAQLVGANLSPAAAGRLFPFEWAKF